MGNYVAKIFGASPVAPLQDHMEKCYKAAKELNAFFAAVAGEDWPAVQRYRESIVKLEMKRMS
jgi:uncharacterized protein Yka (UPF0111/DUF47 family)